MPRRDALDTLLTAMVQEYERQTTLLTATRDRLQRDIEQCDDRVQRLRERISRVLEDGRDDDGEAINPDIEEALDWLDNEGVVDLESLEGAVEFADEALDAVGKRLAELKEIAGSTPPDSFFHNREDEVD